MEIISRQQHDKENPSPANSPTSNGSSTNSNGTGAVQAPPLTPRPVARSEPNPYPTTFVQADTTSFKQVVQMLTGSPNNPKPTQQSDPAPSKNSIPPVKTGQQKKFKLYERRNSLKNGLMINPSVPRFGSGHGVSPRIQELLSPSILDFPSLVLSPVTPLSPSIGSSSEEERVIAEKGFYLHPSPRAATPHGTPEPQLLPLFPVTSPRASKSSI
ncbi:VQ motif-containing protein 4-like [Rutidosis leptorrhynchoides]|uniref:VQ motif-containing protein 4-like n=1 Tax=Rutidosis leptorrhynchoides TaxID=125765 RepID=UPI003A9A09D6